MVVAPVAVAVIRALIPYSSSPSEALAASVAHADLYPVLAAAEVIVVVTMGFAMLGLGRLIQGRAPLLALIGTPVAVLSWILGGGVLGTLDSVTYEMAQVSGAGAIAATMLGLAECEPPCSVGVEVSIAETDQTAQPHDIRRTRNPVGAIPLPSAVLAQPDARLAELHARLSGFGRLRSGPHWRRFAHRSTVVTAWSGNPTPMLSSINISRLSASFGAVSAARTSS